MISAASAEDSTVIIASAIRPPSSCTVRRAPMPGDAGEIFGEDPTDVPDKPNAAQGESAPFAKAVATLGFLLSELTEALDTSQQNVSKHLATLHAEGFVSRRKQGTSVLDAISDPAAVDLRERGCGGIEDRLAALGEALA